MEFRNHTPFPAIAFGGLDARGQEFHVAVLRQTFTWNDAGELMFADEQRPLCEADEFFGVDMRGSIRQESDLCPYKPRCDVIVNATAYPPRRPDGNTLQCFEVRVVVKRPDVPVPLPPEPQGLNPLMSASPEAMHAWRAEVERAKRTVAPSQYLVDKTLVVTGERRFARRAGLPRLVAAVVRFCTLGFVRLPSWRLAAPQPVHEVPVHLELAFGGECRIDDGSAAAEKVPKKFRLTQKQVDAHPDAAGPPVAHDAYVPNPVGQGFTRDWYLDATGAASVSAPQIEYPGHAITLDHFNRARVGKLDGGELPVAGLGVRPKGYPERAKLAGTVDAKFIESDAALPEDFDFAAWNSAWPDQQADSLRGDEYIELVNLVAPETPGVKRDAQGNAVLALVLPGHLPFMLVRFENGAIGELEARLDTLLIDPERREVSCVWRATIGTMPGIRVLEARMLERDDMRAMARTSATSQEQEQVSHG